MTSQCAFDSQINSLSICGPRAEPIIYYTRLQCPALLYSLQVNISSPLPKVLEINKFQKLYSGKKNLLLHIFQTEFQRRQQIKLKFFRKAATVVKKGKHDLILSFSNFNYCLRVKKFQLIRVYQNADLRVPPASPPTSFHHPCAHYLLFCNEGKFNWTTGRLDLLFQEPRAMRSDLILQVVGYCWNLSMLGLSFPNRHLASFSPPNRTRKSTIFYFQGPIYQRMLRAGSKVRL